MKIVFDQIMKRKVVVHVYFEYYMDDLPGLYPAIRDNTNNKITYLNPLLRYRIGKRTGPVHQC